MELKKYQQLVISDLWEFLNNLIEKSFPKDAFRSYWKNHTRNPLSFENIENYKESKIETPNICVKVPTAWGKTFIACNAIHTIFSHILYKNKQNKVIVWLVPSDTILTQTYDAISNPDHPYRKKLMFFFWSKIEVLNKEQILRGTRFAKDQVKEQVSIVLLTFDSLRAKNADTRKLYQENSSMMSFQNDVEKDDISVMNVIESLNPLCIIDESHRATTDLSQDMIVALNPFFVLELTATPKENANIISYVNPFELKKENMVKLPVILHNNKNKEDVIWNSIQMRKKLEEIAKQEEQITWKYIRPIVLFQAQPKNDKDEHTFLAVKKTLIDIGIPENQIAIKTSQINELKWVDLMSRESEIRYIITVNALKEGWDCPFAYILASLANKNSLIDVEQILWRVLRQPYVVKHESDLLNLSYVFTASSNFYDTIDKIILALNNSWFSGKKKRFDNQTNIEDISQIEKLQEQMIISIDNSQKVENLWIIWDNEDDILDTSKILLSSLENPSVLAIEKHAIEQAQDFNKEVEKSLEDPYDAMPFELQQKTDESYIKDDFLEIISSIKVPQYFRPSLTNSLFNIDDIPWFTLLEKEYLMDWFVLNKSDTNINFQKFVKEEIKKIDIRDDKLWWVHVEQENLDKIVTSRFIDLLKAIPEEKHINAIVQELKWNLWRVDDVANEDLEKYIHRVVEDLWKDILDVKENIFQYAKAIKKKIEDLKSEYRKKKFIELIDIWSVTLKDYYSFPKKIIISSKKTNIIKTLYEAENDDFNNFEREIIDKIANSENTVFWCRIQDRKQDSFKLNWFINHYPDFMIYTKSWKMIFIETKWQISETNEDTKNKIELWNLWSSKSWDKFKYFLIAQDNAISWAKTIQDFFNVYDRI